MGGWHDRPMELEPHLQRWAEQIERLQWSGLICDAEWRVAWASDETKEFVGSHDDEALGIGLHVAEAFTKGAWITSVHPDSQFQLVSELGPFVLGDLEERGISPRDVVAEPFWQILEQMEPKPVPEVWTSSFMYVNPTNRDLPEYRVDFSFFHMYSPTGQALGWVILFFMGIRPNLLVLLARGDEQMYERMARLVDPGPRQAAILFCDLYSSGKLSRQLPSAAYFKLVRRLWTGIDAVVAEETGIVGKHAGDGASAFFLSGDLGSSSKAAAAAIRAARRVHEVSEEVFSDSIETECTMKVGVHWGGSLYMGQLVPGGRLDVTALEDEVNEAARLEELAGAGETVASKQLLERLTSEEAASLGLDLEKIIYQPVSDIPGAPEKAIRDAGGLAITKL